MAPQKRRPSQTARARVMGQLVDARMTELGLSSRRLANMVGVDANTISSIRKGEPVQRHPGVLDRVGLALGWPESSLVRFQEGLHTAEELAELRLSTEAVDAVKHLRELAAAGRDLARLAEAAARALDAALRGQAGPR